MTIITEYTNPETYKKALENRLSGPFPKGWNLLYKANQFQNGTVLGQADDNRIKVFRKDSSLFHIMYYRRFFVGEIDLDGETVVVRGKYSFFPIVHMRFIRIFLVLFCLSILEGWLVQMGVTKTVLLTFVPTIIFHLVCMAISMMVDRKNKDELMKIIAEPMTNESHD